MIGRYRRETLLLSQLTLIVTSPDDILEESVLRGHKAPPAPRHLLSHWALDTEPGTFLRWDQDDELTILTENVTLTIFSALHHPLLLPSAGILTGEDFWWLFDFFKRGKVSVAYPLINRSIRVHHYLSFSNFFPCIYKAHF